MKKIVAAIFIATLVTLTLIAGERARILSLPTGKNLSLPVPGYVGRTNSFPATIALSPDKRYAAFLNMGFGTQATGGRQSIAILDLTSNKLREFPDDRLWQDSRQSYFVGLAFSSDGKTLYASIGSITDPTGETPPDTGNGIAAYRFESGVITAERFIRIAPQKLAAGKQVAFALRKTPAGTSIAYPAGIAVLPTGDRYQARERLLVANDLSDNAVVLDAASGEVLQSFDLSRGPFVPSAFPYTVLANKAGTKAWCSLWNSSAVAELDLGTGKVTRWIELLTSAGPSGPGSHPTTMQLSPDESVLYVAMSNTDTVAAIDLQDASVQRLYYTNLADYRHGGSVPLAIALSEDGTRLFAASGSLDAVAVFDTKAQVVGKRAGALGFIPTEWYPSALAVAGKDLLIATAKGTGTGPNNMPDLIEHSRFKREHPYIASLTAGSIARVGTAEIEKNLAAYTREVEENDLLHADAGHFNFPGGKNPIRHIIYVLKENRTYDQILGDLPVGNGDPSLTMYGSEITPNQHKLALQFGVIDNFYDSGEVSGDGHLWSTAATTSDYNERTWPIAYRGKERTYDFGGSVAGAEPLEQEIPDVDDPGTGFLWDNLTRRKMSYRIYGEFVGTVWCRSEKVQSPMQGTPSEFTATCPHSGIRPGEPLPANVGTSPGAASPWPWSVPQFERIKPTKAALRDHYDPQFPDFNTDYPDQLRADEFLREFHAFVHARGSNDELPKFVLLYLPNDHTGGTRPGKATPKASVADNDLALGRVIDAVSHSPYWEDTAIFVVEDDAQNGADHVDAHRSIAFVISKYAPVGPSQGEKVSVQAPKTFVDSHFYTTVSMIHTMEELLGLPPLNLFDAHAPLMGPLVSGPGTHAPYEVDERNLRNGLIYSVNPDNAEGARESSRMDFTRPDQVNSSVLNAILWRNAKGDSPMPQARGK